MRLQLIDLNLLSVKQAVTSSEARHTCKKWRTQSFSRQNGCTKYEQFDSIVPVFTSHETSTLSMYYFYNKFILSSLQNYIAQLIKGLVSTCNFQTLYSQLQIFTNTITILVSRYGVEQNFKTFHRTHVNIRARDLSKVSMSRYSQTQTIKSRRFSFHEARGTRKSVWP